MDIMYFSFIEQNVIFDFSTVTIVTKFSANFKVFYATSLNSSNFQDVSRFENR